MQYAVDFSVKNYPDIQGSFFIESTQLESAKLEARKALQVFADSGVVLTVKIKDIHGVILEETLSWVSEKQKPETFLSEIN
jgi:hypothetical protein